MSQPIPKEWMNEIDRLGSVYRQGVSDFILFASGKDETSTTCPCPCKKCRNRKRFAYDIVRKHLIHYGIESTYRVWVLHGENPYKDRMVNRVEEENSEEGLGMRNFVDVAYGMHEELVGDLCGGDGSQAEYVEPPVVLEPDLGNVWNQLMEEFEPNVPQATARREAEKDFPQKFRSAKCALRKEILRKCGSVEEAIAACPVGKDPNHWAAFVRNESTAEVRARNAKNAENAKKNIYRHTNGRDTYANKLDKMDKEDPSRKHGRLDSWKQGHERRDGTILESARTHYEQVEASHKRRKDASAGGEGSVMEEDYDNDELAEVFGPDKGSRTRGISSNKSKKQLQRSGIAKALLQQASSSSNSELKGEMNEMKSSLANVMGLLKEVLKAVKNNGTWTAQPSCGPTTPETEVGSNSVRRSTQQNLMNMFDTENPPSGTLGSSPNVSLLDRDGVVVAKGYVMTETAGDCNGRKVLAGEKKVYIEEVLVGEALVYDGPQDGVRFLDGFSAGGPLIWLESRMQVS